MKSEIVKFIWEICRLKEEHAQKKYRLSQNGKNQVHILVEVV